MGRIEYEYPLFKVYYSNNSNNSNIRGNPGLKADSGSWRGEVGTTAEIFEYNDGEAEDGELEIKYVALKC